MSSVTLSNYLLIILTIVNSICCVRQDDPFKEAEQVNCGLKADRRMDRVFSQLMVIGSERPAPESLSAFKKQCQLFDKNFSFMLGYIKSCISPFGRTIGKLIIFPIRKQMNTICKSKTVTPIIRELINAGKCANIARKPFQECNARIIDAMVGISMAPFKKRMYMSCCHGNIYDSCIKDVMEENKGCTRHTADWLEDYFQRTSGNSMTMMCGDYTAETDKCTKLIKETPKPNYSKANPRPKSMFRPMIKIVEDIPDDAQV